MTAVTELPVQKIYKTKTADIKVVVGESVHKSVCQGTAFVM